MTYIFTQVQRKTFDNVVNGTIKCYMAALWLEEEIKSKGKKCMNAMGTHSKATERWSEAKHGVGTLLLHTP